MTVKELVELLGDFPQDAVVVVADDGECCSSILSPLNVDLEDVSEITRKYYRSLPGTATQIVTLAF